MVEPAVPDRRNRMSRLPDREPCPLFSVFQGDEERHSMNTQSKFHIMARAGYGARGIVFLLIAGLALFSSFGGGRPDTGSAFDDPPRATLRADLDCLDRDRTGRLRRLAARPGACQCRWAGRRPEGLCGPDRALWQRADLCRTGHDQPHDGAADVEWERLRRRGRACSLGDGPALRALSRRGHRPRFRHGRRGDGDERNSPQLWTLSRARCPEKTPRPC